MLPVFERVAIAGEPPLDVLTSGSPFIIAMRW